MRAVVAAEISPRAAILAGINTSSHREIFSLHPVPCLGETAPQASGETHPMSQSKELKTLWLP